MTDTATAYWRSPNGRALTASIQRRFDITSAQHIADLLSNDGQRWATHDDVQMDELIDLHGGAIERRSGASSDEWRAVFPDGSAITVSGGAWDIGYAGCWCWAGHGHENCTAGEG
jgi:hypothetical protein